MSVKKEEEIIAKFTDVASDWKSEVINTLLTAWEQKKDIPVGYSMLGVGLKEDKDKGTITIGFTFERN